MTRRLFVFSIILLVVALLLVSQPAWAQEKPQVRAVLFFSESCPHCHEVIYQVLPPLEEKYGESLVILFINTRYAQAQTLFQATVEKYNVPQEMRGVPLMVVGEHVMVGSSEIPERLPGLIDAYLEEGGVDWPDIPGLQEILAMTTPAVTPTYTPPPPAAEVTPEEVSPVVEATPAPLTSPLEISLPTATPTPTPFPTPAPGASPAPTATFPFDEPMPESDEPGLLEQSGVALAAFAGMLGSVLVLSVWLVVQNWRERKSRVVRPLELRGFGVPVLCIAGIIVSGYLSYVKFAHAVPICGPIGDCDAVQASEYSVFLGIPVAFLGLLAYVVILALWFAARGSGAPLRSTIVLLVWGISFFGVIFSAYLTMVEAFIIMATCMWCVASAVIITVIFWLTTIPLLKTPPPTDDGDST